MTKKHRNRLLLAVVLVIAVVGVMSAPIAASAGPAAALGIAAVTALPALLLLGVIAYIMRGKDKEHVALTDAAPPRA